jgi:hypothetical protein
MIQEENDREELFTSLEEVWSRTKHRKMKYTYMFVSRHQKAGHNRAIYTNNIFIKNITTFRYLE